MTRTELGKIKSASFGWGGYNDAMVGATFDLGGSGWGVGDHWGAWGVPHTQYCKSCLSGCHTQTLRPTRC